MSKRVFVSDLHCSAPGGTGTDCYLWLSEHGIHRATRFLQYLVDCARKPGNPIDEVVLIGDIFDTWVIPHDEMPPEFSAIVNAPRNAELLDALGTLCSCARVIYLPGNHDMHVSKHDVATHFKQMVYGGTASADSVFVAGRLHAEHGSAHALFNAPDPLRRARLPLGYFLTRLHATTMRDRGKTVRGLATLIDDILEVVGPQQVAECVFEAVLEEAGLTSDTEILMPKSLWAGESVKAGNIQKMYADLYDEWGARRGTGKAFKSLVAEIGWLADIADNICKSSGPNVVVFGHSHRAELDKDSWFVDDRIYANCGTWCDDDKPPNFVEVETIKGDPRSSTEVRLLVWNDETSTPEFVGRPERI